MIDGFSQCVSEMKKVLMEGGSHAYENPFSYKMNLVIYQYS